MSNQTAVADKTQEGTAAEVVITPMPDTFEVWGTYHFDPRDIVIDHTKNVRRFGVVKEKVAAFREDFLNSEVGQLQNCGVYWDEVLGSFVLMFGFHRADAALGITNDGMGPDENGAFLLRCVVHPAGNVVKALGVSLAENSPRTKADMTPIDKAYTITRMIEAGYQQKDIAARLGYSKAIISQLKHFVDYPLVVQKAIDSGKMTQAAAFELIPLADKPEELAEKAKELMAATGRVTIEAVRASNRKEKEADSTESGDDTGAEETEAPAKTAKTTRSMKELMAFLRDYSDVEKGAVLSPCQVALGTVLKFAEGKIKEKAAQKQLDTKLAVVA